MYKLFLAFTCPKDMIKCKDGLQCIRRSDLCDNRDDCNDKSDEDEDFCRGNLVFTFHIYIQKCISSYIRHTPMTYIEDKSDEDEDFCIREYCYFIQYLH